MPESIGVPAETATALYNCPVEASLAALGGKWKIIILWYLADQPHRFSELNRLLPNISEKVLTQQLRELARDGLIHREVYPQVPPKVEYSLTPYGQTVQPIMDMLCDWGEIHCERMQARAEWEAKQR